MSGSGHGRQGRGWFALPVLVLVVARGARSDEDTARALDPRRTPWYLSAQAGTVVLGRSASAATEWRLGRTLAAGGAFGRRWGRFDAFVEAEANGWSSTRPDGSRDHSLAVDLGAGGGVSYAGGLLRTSLAAGASILGIPTDVDPAGSTGVYLDLRPVGYRWPVGRAWVVGVQPLSLTVAMPVLTGIPTRWTTAAARTSPRWSSARRRSAARRRARWSPWPATTTGPPWTGGSPAAPPATPTRPAATGWSTCRPARPRSTRAPPRPNAARQRTTTVPRPSWGSPGSG